MSCSVQVQCSRRDLVETLSRHLICSHGSSKAAGLSIGAAIKEHCSPVAADPVSMTHNRCTKLPRIMYMHLATSFTTVPTDDSHCKVEFGHMIGPRLTAAEPSRFDHWARSRGLFIRTTQSTRSLSRTNQRTTDAAQNV